MISRDIMIDVDSFYRQCGLDCYLQLGICIPQRAPRLSTTFKHALYRLQLVSLDDGRNAAGGCTAL